MQGSSSRTWIFPKNTGHDAPGEAITEPSGTGPFAEAMRELIAQLSPVPQGLREAQAEPAASEAPHQRATAFGSAHSHLRLVR